MHYLSTLIQASALIAVVSAQTTGKRGDADAIANNPVGASYYAGIVSSSTLAPELKGSVIVRSNDDGKGVTFAINVYNLPDPAKYGPFMYHLHDQPVPANGNCTGTLAHLDPYIRGEDPVCDPKAPQTCQVGDLSGKFGNITSDSFRALLHDDYATLVPGLGAFFPNRSIVLHTNTKTRIACSNFTIVAEGKAPGDVDGGGQGTYGTIPVPNGDGSVKPKC